MHCASTRRSGLIRRSVKGKCRDWTPLPQHHIEVSFYLNPWRIPFSSSFGVKNTFPSIPVGSSGQTEAMSVNQKRLDQAPPAFRRFLRSSIFALLIRRIYSFTGFATVFSFICLFRQYGVLSQAESFFVPLLELQPPQQMATLYFFAIGPSLLKCSIVAMDARLLRENRLWQNTQRLSLARISFSTSSEIPYVLDI